METLGRINGNTVGEKIDLKDKKILVSLSQNARMQASDIAKKVMLSRDAISYRIRKLEEDKIILNYHPCINLKKFGYSKYNVFMLLDEKAKKQHDGLLSYVMHHPNTLSLMSYTDTWDMEWSLLAKDIKEFDYLVGELLTKFPDVVLEKQKMAVLNEYISLPLPKGYYTNTGIELIEKKSNLKNTNSKKENDMECNLDDTDIELLKLLNQNARQSSYDLGKVLKISPDTVIYRIKKILDSEIIHGFETVFNLSKLKHMWCTYAINFRKFDAKDEGKWKEFVKQNDHILYAAKMFGPWDMILHIVADNPEDYHHTVKDIKNAFADIIISYQTWLAYEELYYNTMPRVLLEKQ